MQAEAANTFGAVTFGELTFGAAAET
jgi:hypothetical protein